MIYWGAIEVRECVSESTNTGYDYTPRKIKS